MHNPGIEKERRIDRRSMCQRGEVWGCNYYRWGAKPQRYIFKLSAYMGRVETDRQALQSVQQGRYSRISTLLASRDTRVKGSHSQRTQEHIQVNKH